MKAGSEMLHDAMKSESHTRGIVMRTVGKILELMGICLEGIIHRLSIDAGKLWCIVAK
jgi:hypothetical protein